METQTQSFRNTYYCTVKNEKKLINDVMQELAKLSLKNICTLLYRCCHSGYIFQICNDSKLRHQLRRQVLHVKKSVKTQWGTKILKNSRVISPYGFLSDHFYPFFPHFFYFKSNQYGFENGSKVQIYLSFLLFLKEAVLLQCKMSDVKDK